jgi:hypothetical protein
MQVGDDDDTSVVLNCDYVKMLTTLTPLKC